MSSRKWNFAQNNLILANFLRKHGIVSRNIYIDTDPLKMTQNTVVHMSGLCGVHCNAATQKHSVLGVYSKMLGQRLEIYPLSDPFSKNTVFNPPTHHFRLDKTQKWSNSHADSLNLKWKWWRYSTHVHPYSFPLHLPSHSLLLPNCINILIPIFLYFLYIKCFFFQ